MISEPFVEEVIKSKGSLDRQTIAQLVARYEDASAKVKVFEVLKLCAKKYADTFLGSYFELVPWDANLMYDLQDFAKVYTFVATETNSFKEIKPETIEAVLVKHPSTILVFRLIIGYSLDELELMLSRQYDVAFSKDKLRAIEQGQFTPALTRKWGNVVVKKLSQFLYDAAYGKTFGGLGRIRGDTFRLRLTVLGVDPSEGWRSVARIASTGVPFESLLYQRYVGGTVRQALDAGSELKADILEEPVSSILEAGGITYYRTKARERIEGWEQAPDFLVPNRDSPTVIIEAKVAEDGGTARDKASRIERLARMAKAKGITCIAVVDGKGFRRINDVLVPILVSCRGKVFSYSNLSELVELPELAELADKS